MKPWQEYTPEELDRQYDNRSAVPEHPGIFREWDRRSGLLAREAGGPRDLAYGPHPRQAVDLYLPKENTPGPAPLHVFLHGGYWQAMSRESSAFVAEGLMRAGVAVAVPGYRLCPEASMEEIVEDVRQAMAWLHANGASHGVDATRVQVSGHSAGGHLLAMLWATDWSRYGDGIPPGFLRSGIAVSGLFELEPLVPTKVNRALGMDISRARDLSPALSRPLCRAPLLLAVGEAESDEYHRQSRFLCGSWAEAGVPVRMEVLEGRNHFTIMDELAREDGALCRAALEMAGRGGKSQA